MKNIFLSNNSYDHLTENGQKAPNAFCLVNKDKVKDHYFTVSPWFICRDYFCDSAFTLSTGHQCHAYGFNALEYNWKGEGFITTIGSKKGEDVFKALDSVNAYMKKWDCPTISMEKINIVNPEDVGKLKAERSWNYYDIDMTTGENMYFVSTPAEWNKSTYHLYMLSSIVRSLYWFADLGINLMEESAADIFNKLGEGLAGRAELSWLNLFNDTIMPYYRDIHVAEVSNVLCDSSEVGEYLCGDGPDDEDDYDEYNNRETYNVVDFIHDVGGCASVAGLPFSVKMLTWQPWHGMWEPRKLEDLMKSPRSGANSDLYMALVTALATGKVHCEG